MFTKALFLVLSGCTIIFANPASHRDIEESLSFRAKRSPVAEKIAEWWNQVWNEVKSWPGKVKSTAQNVWDKITGKDKTEATQQQLNELQDLHNQVQDQRDQAIDAKQAEWERILAEQEERLKQFREMADKEVESEINLWDQKFDQLKFKAEKVIKSLS